MNVLTRRLCSSNRATLVARQISPRGGLLRVEVDIAQQRVTLIGRAVVSMRGVYEGEAEYTQC